MKNYLLLLILAASLLFLSSCDKDDDDIGQYFIPSSYSFDNVSYSGQTQRLAMLAELKSYMRSATSGQALDVVRLKAMYANDVLLAQWVGTYESSKQLKDKTFEPVQADFDLLFESLALISQSTMPGTEGTAGLVISQDGSKTYLLSDKGLEHAQIIEKGLMGACLYYQATAVYMGEERMDADNELIEPGQGTEMEHHWDEAFGYFGVPIDFPANADGLLFWGSYSNQRDALLGSNARLMEALIKGRAAITNKDITTRDEAIDEARHEWERIAVGSAIHYLNEGISHFEDMALRGHLLSEAVGFLYALQFNPAKNIDNNEIGDLLILVAGADQFEEMNLYTTNSGNLQQAKDRLAAYYELTTIKDEL